jgi:hypothetical protein
MENIQRNLFLITISLLIIASLLFTLYQLQDALIRNTIPNPDPKNNQLIERKQPVIEKMDGVFIQEFDNENILHRTVVADDYIRHKDSPAVLLNPVINYYNKKGKITTTIKYKKATILDSGVIHASNPPQHPKK